MKSELYRITHSKDLYVMIGICSGLVVLMNIVLAISVRRMINFTYATTNFSLGTLMSQVQIILIFAFIVASIVFGDEYKHRTLKNSISFGISRAKIFCGKYLVSLAAAVVSFIVIMVCYIGSAFLLLENSGNMVVHELFLSMVATIPSAIMSLTLAIALLFVIDNGINAAMIWSAVVIFIPIVLDVMGRRIELCYKIGNYLPWTMLSRNKVTHSTFLCVWDTPEGLIRCILVGVLSTVVFGIIGVRAFKKKDVK